MDTLTAGSHITTIDELEPLDDIAGVDQLDGPWFTVLVVPSSDCRLVVVLDEDGTEHEADCLPGQVVRRRLGWIPRDKPLDVQSVMDV